MFGVNTLCSLLCTCKHRSNPTNKHGNARKRGLGEHRAQLPLVHIDFKHTETKSGYWLVFPNIRRRASTGVIVPPQPHHCSPNESRKGVNLIYPLCETLQSPTQIPQPALFTDSHCFLLGQQRTPAPSQETGILQWQHPAHLKSNIHNNNRSSMNLVNQRACLVWIYLFLIIWLLQKQKVAPEYKAVC